MRTDTYGNILRLGESQRKDGRYVYRWVDENGKKRTSSADDLAMLRRKIAEIHRYMDSGLATAAMGMTLDELYRLWYAEKRSLSVRTRQRYEGIYANRLSTAFGSTPISELRRATLQQYFDGLCLEEGLKASTVKNYSRLLYQVLQFGLSEGYLVQNPAADLRVAGRQTGRHRKAAKKAMSLEEQKRFLVELQAESRYSRWQPAVAFMLHTGLRAGELEALRWADVDLEGGVLHIRHTMGRVRLAEPGAGKANGDTRRGHYRKSLTEPKTDAGRRTVPLVAMAREALRQEREQQELRGIVCRERVDGYEDYVFLTNEGRLLTAAVLNPLLREAVEGIRRKEETFCQDLERVTCHTLRHTFATRLCEAGVNLKVIQAVMGHADIQMTMNIYAEATAELMTAEIELLEDT